jgi:hypothetical protein
MRFRSYASLKKFANSHAIDLTPQERWAGMERMRQLRYGYKPGELKMQKNVIRTYILAEFREKTEREYEEEIKKYGPR